MASGTIPLHQGHKMDNLFWRDALTAHYNQLPVGKLPISAGLHLAGIRLTRDSWKTTIVT
jgi:hypothetical protein